MAAPVCAVAVGAATVASPAQAQAQAQGIHYTVKIEAPAALEQLLSANLDLMRWRGNPRLDYAQLARLVKSTPAQARPLIATEGYYSPQVSAVLEGDPAAPLVRVTVEPGQAVRVVAVDIVLQGAAGANAAREKPALQALWPLGSGRVFRQADWEQAKRLLLRRLLQMRYPRARIAASSATVDPDARTATLRVVLASGPAVRLGELRIDGLQRYPSQVITNLAPPRPGDDYSEAALQAFQARLQDTGYFSNVDVSADMSAIVDEQINESEQTQEARQEQERAPGQAGQTPMPTGAAPQEVTLPLLVHVSENKRKNVSAGVGYSTNTGNRAQLSFDDLSVFGLRMKSALTVETKKQNAHVDFYVPTNAAAYNDSVGTSFERNDINGEVTSVSTLAARRAWGDTALERSVALEYLNERKSVTGQLASISQSLPLTYAITLRQLDSQLAPARGYAVSAQLGGALLPVLTEQAFVRASARLVRYQPLGPSNTVILRVEAGGLASRQKPGVPATYLFRAGGDQSVRGYGYQQLGVQEGSAIVGGRYLLVGSAELDHWFKPNWGGAVFYDAGNAGDVFRALAPKSGYGVGLRWRSPVGPINVDAAYGHAVRKYRLHFSLGLNF
ncbi:MAG: autotransporter assembly complex family protein [Pseudomonadota bacterium]